MDSHELATELAAAAPVLDTASLAHLGYLGPDGTPRVIPIGFWWDGAQFVLSTAERAPKVAALRADPRVGLSVDGGDTPGTARALSVRGLAEVSMVDGVTTEYLAAARRSMPPGEYAEFERACRAMYPRMARIAITPQWARFYDFGAGRLPRTLLELAREQGLGGG